GTYHLYFTNSGTGVIAFWQDTQKRNAMPSSWTDGSLPTNGFFVEGVATSSSINDITIHLDYTVGTSTFHATAQVSVTPIVTNFTLTVATPPQNGTVINFTNNTNGIEGLKAALLGQGNGDGTAGVTYDASVRRTSVAGALVFVQNVDAVLNNVS